MRLYQIDALRGFALLGILIVNIFIFHAPYAHYSAFYSQFEGINSTVVEHVVFFFGGKFMFIYAFLFGYSFWLQFEKTTDFRAFKHYWNKRMLLLAVFGILHILLLSYGDILLPYAVLGLSLPLVARWSNQRIIFFFLLIYLIPVYEFVLRGFIEFPSIFIQPVETLERYIEINGQGSFGEIFLLRIQDYFSLRNEKLILYIPKELALFLLGILAARAEWATKLNKQSGLLFCFCALLVIASMYFYKREIIAHFNYEESVWQRIVVGLIIHFAEFIHGLFYIVGFFLLWRIPIVQKAIFALNYTGKLSLTNYIMQSFICLVIFSGFGYYGQLNPLDLVITAITIYLAQLLFSFLWLKKNKYGPLEYIWRKYSRVH